MEHYILLYGNALCDSVGSRLKQLRRAKWVKTTQSPAAARQSDSL